jgi:ADP-ribosyl-[dinitrogen reductase] hydrolase
MRRESIVGSLLGTAVGDALGLPYEGLSRQRAAKLFGAPDRHRFFFGAGMISDDTEHSAMVAQSLIASGGDVATFQNDLSWRLRIWLLTLPSGVGFATLRAILKMMLGFAPGKSGVFSAGNGPAMRAAILGAAIADTPTLCAFVAASTRLSHTDPKAEYGALAIALAAQTASKQTPFEAKTYLASLEDALPKDAAELVSLVNAAAESVRSHESTEQFAISIGQKNGVSGYVYHTVPVAIHAWLANPNDYVLAVTSIIKCGGDTDSTAAIVGGIVGASVGKVGIDSTWRAQVRDWPRSMPWLQMLAEALAKAMQTGLPTKPPEISFFGMLARNFAFFLIVLAHLVRRVLPPY